MNVYATEDIRNVVIVGHGSVGKTTLTEAALFVGGAISRMGRVDDANTVSDYDEDEHRRKFSINLSLAVVEWEGRKLNLIDTPGYADFVTEVISVRLSVSLTERFITSRKGIVLYFCRFSRSRSKTTTVSLIE